MVCDDCKSQLSVVSAPDPWKAGSASSSAHRKIDENKALRKGVRANPYGNCCKICKMKVQQNNATYCTMCAYAKGICAICGKQVLDTSMYKMSEGGNFMHTVGKREESSFKSQEQIAREAAQNDLFTYLQSTGQVGRMPTREALEVAGRGDLAKALIASFGGLHAAADSMGLSKRLLNEEAEAKKSQKRHAAQKEAAEAEERRREEEEARAEAAAQAEEERQRRLAAGEEEEDDEDDDLPPGVALPLSAEAKAAAEAEAAAAEAAAAAAAAPAPPPRSTDNRWQYDPNVGLYFQLSTECYFDSTRSMYYANGEWSREKP